MRSLIAFPCAGETLLGTLDAAPGTTGLVIVSGGNEIRCGAHRGMALLAETIAAHGHPVFRYDRRGIGDSSGINRGFLSTEADLVAATAAFRTAQPHVTRLIAFGNCDAASTLALFGRAAGIDRLLLANPWLVEATDDLPPPAAIRAHYARRLRDPRQWLRLLSGGIDLSKAVRGLRRSTDRAPLPPLAARIIAGIESWGPDARILLAERDATAIAFHAATPHLPVTTIPTASHSFARDADKAALLQMVLAFVAG
ncbi:MULTISPECIES: hydrolase 1, exosortase A system-associated [unclassified Sphingomonas]|uniref:hydrolase 1, exosortase A system-associated n=2 Tax=Bacteria TaxID=2 RepID=UPI000E109C11|nr:MULTISPECIES: hydrolase 1, exosortase A system-associated [unclassified Sphingomonas]AXJ96761.1 hydrolase 1, exosortase A system-associated [Sphingomonas sp. FARSPH]